jgi:hypothetical protein
MFLNLIGLYVACMEIVIHLSKCQGGESDEGDLGAATIYNAPLVDELRSLLSETGFCSGSNAG